MITVGSFVSVSQFNGIVLHGRCIAVFEEDGETMAVVRYYCVNHQEEPPRATHRVCPLKDLRAWVPSDFNTIAKVV